MKGMPEFETEEEFNKFFEKETGVPRNTITRHCRGEVKKPRWKLQ